MKAISIIFLIFSLTFSPLIGSEAIREIAIAGSDLGYRFLPELIEAYKKAGHATSFNVTLDNQMGFGEFLSSDTDLLLRNDIPSRRLLMHPDLPKSPITVHHLGAIPFAVVVSRQLAVDEVSVHQLRGIYLGDIRNWKDLGGPELPIEPRFHGFSMLNYKVSKSFLRIPDYGETVKKYSGATHLVHGIQEEPEKGIIGFTSLTWASQSGIKILKIEGKDPTLFERTYPFYTIPCFVSRSQSSEEAGRFADWTISAPAALRILGQHGVVNHEQTSVEQGADDQLPARAESKTE